MQGSKMATLNRINLVWGYGERKKAKKSVRISLQLKLQRIRAVKRKIDRIFKDNSKLSKLG